MTKLNDLGLPSASKASTQQQDREKLEYPAGYAFMSKTEIKRAYEALLRENQNLKERAELRLELTTAKNQLKELQEKIRELKRGLN